MIDAAHVRKHEDNRPNKNETPTNDVIRSWCHKLTSNVDRGRVLFASRQARAHISGDLGQIQQLCLEPKREGPFRLAIGADKHQRLAWLIVNHTLAGVRQGLNVPCTMHGGAGPTALALFWWVVVNINQLPLGSHPESEGEGGGVHLGGGHLGFSRENRDTWKYQTVISESSATVINLNQPK